MTWMIFLMFACEREVSKNIWQNMANLLALLSFSTGVFGTYSLAMTHFTHFIQKFYCMHPKCPRTATLSPAHAL